ncbi:electron transfer flavo protein, alpha subunit [Metschnikowia bicuspidata var. bicuspidata NRRL YB-4993]|uniref:Probable electron transfer flavoprotein subunit alpha n=1 Tax=Metschnikowia bicuspidata var. bicuspidata NRRL YB-4993 TaxID=869754 RepID=A0A1A0HB23_9ASCO|nr:electron transfer flavo protein, alpha subunit [Metschnikowia bicuspidata var. bicuspidata NRRL YB-4993]OBA21211.1 electron transfer flavo protein, alpha subunit [Metschnikowia bicuspidata var. bicuspidata NRRL YB-4993]
MLRSLIYKRSFSTTKISRQTLAFIEVSNGSITSLSLSAITAAQNLGKPITAILAGTQAEKVASSTSKIDGISKVLSAGNGQYDHYLAEELVPLLKEVIETRKFTHMITPASAVGKSFLPRLGALLDVQPISDVVEVLSEDTFVRPIYAGNALATVKSNDLTKLVSIRASAFQPAKFNTESVSIEEIDSLEKSDNRTKFLSEQLIESDRPELGSATKVVAGGRGLKNRETFESLIEPLASKLNAAIGASRAAVDSGFCDNSLQVGQTGKIVAPDLYIAVGVSGAIQHLAGMKDSKTIVAINKDPEAPIFNIADIGLVSDLHEAVPELSNKL